MDNELTRRTAFQLSVLNNGHVARGSTTVHASFGKVKVRRVNSGGARKFHLGLRGASGIGLAPDGRAGGPRLARADARRGRYWREI